MFLLRSDRTSLCLIILLWVFGASVLSAQEADKSGPARFWVTFGAGVLKSSPEQADLSVLMSASYRRHIHLFSLRYLSASNSLGCEGLGDCKEFKDISLLYGLSSRNKKLHYSASLGVSYVSIKAGGAADEDLNKTVSRPGLALGAECFWRPINTIGIGIYLSGNLNSENNLFGTTLNLQFVFH